MLCNGEGYVNRRSVKFGMIAVFASLHAVLYFLSFGLWRNWAIYLEPIEAIILGPYAGFSAALMGSVIARIFKPTDLWMFGIIAEPLAVLICGLIVKGEWKTAFLLYTTMLTAFFTNSLGKTLPLWTILDILSSFGLLYPTAKIGSKIYVKNIKQSYIPLILTSFTCTATDSLTRIFLFIPAGLYTLFNFSFDKVRWIFMAGAVDSYIEDILVVITSILIGIPLLNALRKFNRIKLPIT